MKKQIKLLLLSIVALFFLTACSAQPGLTDTTALVDRINDVKDDREYDSDGRTPLADRIRGLYRQ